MRINPIFLLLLGVGASFVSGIVHVNTVRSGERQALNSQVNLVAGLLSERLRNAVLRSDGSACESLVKETLAAAPVETAVVMGLDGKALASWSRTPLAAGSATPSERSVNLLDYPIRAGRRPIGKLVLEPAPVASSLPSVTALLLQSLFPLLLGILAYALARGKSAIPRMRRSADLVQVELERALADSKEALENATHAKSMFLANMSHEIRTPLNGVLGMADLLLNTKLDDRQKKFATTVRNSAESLLNIVNDLLDFSRIESGNLHLEMLDFDLRECVEDVVQLFSEQGHAKNLEFICQLSDDLPRLVRGDPARLRQVLVNLIGNAVKFTEKGEILVRVLAIDDDGDHTTCRFQVRDTGIGIAREVQERIFDSFVQLDASTTRRFGGAGLGLAISRNLVELMGGSIRLQSEPGEGTEFTVDVSLETVATVMRNSNAQASALARLRVLVVDDNETNREVLGHQLESWSIPFDAVNGGSSALKALRAAHDEGTPFDVAILDMQMPSMDGIELARIIKADTELAAIRLMLLTSAVIDLEPAQLHDVGFTHFTSKPVRQSQLYNCLVQLACNAPKAPAQLRTADAVTSTPRQFKANVLLVEDNAVNQEVARHMLESLGCEVTVVENGRVAVGQIESQRFDIVLMDCQMPVMDGFEATSAVREREHLDGVVAACPIIALTANALAGDREQCLAAGMDDYVSKPFKLTELERVLVRWLPKHREEVTPECVVESRAQAEPAGDCGINVAALETIRAMQRPGQPDLVAKVVRLYVDRAPGLVDEIGEAVEHGDAAAIQSAAHSLKSSSANVGANVVSECARTLEQLAREMNLDDAGAALKALREAYEPAARELQIYLPAAKRAAQ